jgi:hypothetical protein
MLFTMAFRRTEPETMVFFYPGLPEQRWCAGAIDVAAVDSGLPQSQEWQTKDDKNLSIGREWQDLASWKARVGGTGPGCSWLSEPGLVSGPIRPSI